MITVLSAEGKDGTPLILVALVDSDLHKMISEERFRELDLAELGLGPARLLLFHRCTDEDVLRLFAERGLTPPDIQEHLEPTGDGRKIWHNPAPPPSGARANGHAGPPHHPAPHHPAPHHPSREAGDGQ